MHGRMDQILKQIDIGSWERKEHFEFFRKNENSQYSISFDVDITGLDSLVKQHKLSFYYVIIHMVTQASNRVPAFRYRLRGNDVVLHDKLDPSFTDMFEDKELIKFVTVPMHDNMIEFVANSKRVAKQQNTVFTDQAVFERDDLLFITSIPWIPFTQLTHATSSLKQDSVPKIGWGQYHIQEGRLKLPMSVQVNHIFVDGWHLAQFKENLDHIIAQALSVTNEV